MNLFTLAFKNLWNRKVRTVLTVLGVGVSIAAFVSLIGLASNLTDAYKATYERRETDLIVREKGSFDLLSSAIDKEYINRIREIPQVLDVNAMLIDFSLMKLKDYVLVFGWDVNSSLFNNLKIRGRLPKSLDEAIIGEMIACKFNKKIGDKIEIKNSKFTIVGIFQSRSVFEEGSVVMLLERLQQIKKTPTKVTLFNVTVKKDTIAGKKRIDENKEVEYVQSQISNLFPDAEVKNVHSIVSSDNLASTLINFAWAISLIAFIIAISGIINTMVTSVLEQTREIGILIAIGWRNVKIISLIMYESILLSFLGGIVGLILGYGIMRTLISLPQLQNISRMHYDIMFMLKAVSISLFICFLSGIYPALKAISIEPIEVLRYE